MSRFRKFALNFFTLATVAGLALSGCSTAPGGGLSILGSKPAVDLLANLYTGSLTDVVYSNSANTLFAAVGYSVIAVSMDPEGNPQVSRVSDMDNIEVLAIDDERQLLYATGAMSTFYRYGIKEDRILNEIWKSSAVKCDSVLNVGVNGYSGLTYLGGHETLVGQPCFQIYDENGSLVEANVTVPGADFPRGVMGDGTSPDIFYMDDHAVVRMRPDYTPVFRSDIGEFSKSMVFNPVNNKLYVYGDKVHILDANAGEPAATSVELPHAHGIELTVDNKGNVFAIGSGPIVSVFPRGASEPKELLDLSEDISSEITGVSHIAVSDDGLLFISVSGSLFIFRYDAEEV